MEFGTFITALGSFVESNKDSLTSAISDSSTVPGVFQDRIKSSLKDKFLHLSGISGILRGVVGAAWHLSGELTGSYLKLNYIRSSPKEAIFEIIKDPELVIFFEKNADIVENVIMDSFLTNVSDEGTKKQIIEESKKASAELVTLITAVQRLVSENHISSLDKLVECISANNDKEMESLLEPIQRSLKILTDLVNLNPEIIIDSMMIGAVTPDSEIHRIKYESYAVLALRNSIDRAKRDSEKKLGTQFVEYRENKDRGVGHFLDSYCDHFIRKKSLSGVHLEDVDCSHLEIDDFDFKFSELKRVNFSNTKIKNCDFGCTLFVETIDFSDAEIDIETFKTMLPSLRQAKASGQSVNLNNCKIIGNIKSLDLSGIDITGLNLELLKVKKLKIQKGIKCTLPISRSEVISSDVVGRGDEVIFRRRLARFTRINKEEIARSLLKGRSNTVSLSAFFRDYENSLYDSLVQSCKSDLEIKTLLDILDENIAVSTELNKHWDEVKHAVSYKTISTGYIWNKERPVASGEVLEGAFGKFFHAVKHEAKFRFRDRIRNKPLSNDEGKTFTDHPERVEAFDKVLDYISRDDYLHDFVSHTPKDKPTWIGKKVRVYVVAVVPSFAKPYFYESTQVGKMIESRSILQLMGMTVRFLMNYRSISRLWSNVVPVLDDLNYYYVWRKDHDLKKSRADVLYHVIQNKMIRKNLVQYNKDGTVKKDESGRVVINEKLLDVILSTFDVTLNRQELVVIARSLYEIIEILEESKSHRLIKELSHTENIHDFKNKVLHTIKDKISKDSLSKLERNLEHLMPIFTKFISPSPVKMASDSTKAYKFPHYEQNENMNKILAQLSPLDMVDIGKKVFKGQVIDFSYGKIGSDSEDVTFTLMKADRFKGASSEFRNVRFKGCVISGEKVEDRPNFVFLGPNFDHAKFFDVLFNETEMNHFYGDCIEFKGGKILDCLMKQSVLTDAIFSGTFIENSDLSGSELRGSRFEKVEISKEAILDNIDFRYGYITHSRLRDVSIQNSNLESLSIWDANLENVKFDGANLQNAEFTDVVLKNCSFRNANLIGINLENIVVKGSIDLTGAEIQEDQLKKIQESARINGAVITGEPKISKLSHLDRLEASRSKTLLREP